MTAVGRALSLAEMVHHREQHAESDQHSEPERRPDQHGVHFVLPYYQAVSHPMRLEGAVIGAAQQFRQTSFRQPRL